MPHPERRRTRPAWHEDVSLHSYNRMFFNAQCVMWLWQYMISQILYKWSMVRNDSIHPFHISWVFGEKLVTSKHLPSLELVTNLIWHTFLKFMNQYSQKIILLIWVNSSYWRYGLKLHSQFWEISYHQYSYITITYHQSTSRYYKFHCSKTLPYPTYSPLHYHIWQILILLL